jgi:hypothetical protein
MRAIRLVICALALTAGCASFPEPAQHLADAESARRAAQELGAASDPNARLHVQLADEQIRKARVQMKEGNNKAADLLLIRAHADAELALALVREQSAHLELEQTMARADAARSITGRQGVQP